MNFEYIIVQAGGKGTRLEHLTANKPKALVPVENLPMLFHLFKKFPDNKFIVIADYKKDVLREYLESFANVKYKIVDTAESGTCSGVKQSLALLPENEPFMFIWSDLILSDNFNIPAKEDNYIGISQTFPCRWSYKGGNFEEVKSEEYGIAGLFVFKDKNFLNNIPESGEFVRWLKETRIKFETLGLAGTKEFGLLSEYENLEKQKCRPFNRITIDDNIVIKEAIDEQGKKLALLEQKWYEYAIDKNINNIPKTHSFDPIRMEKINGKNIYEYTNLTHKEKTEILQKLTDALKILHNKERVNVDTFSIKEAYYGKTMERLRKIRDLVPFADKKTIVINGRECRNIFYYKRDLERKLDALKCEFFAFIHGDCTFSNLMLKNDVEPIFIDPRGYFGYTEIYGDPNYDWAKLYYSIVGNYDKFNLKDFRLTIGENSVDLKIVSNGWEDMEQEFFAMSATDPQVIKLLHAIIWLSLTTYAWQDYDSICGAFYNGLYYLEDLL